VLTQLFVMLRGEQQNRDAVEHRARVEGKVDDAAERAAEARAAAERAARATGADLSRTIETVAPRGAGGRAGTGD
jgi:F0F1-type ATP synthase membrane subunit b/b'